LGIAHWETVWEEHTIYGYLPRSEDHVVLHSSWYSCSSSQSHSNACVKTWFILPANWFQETKRQRCCSRWPVRNLDKTKLLLLLQKDMELLQGEDLQWNKGRTNNFWRKSSLGNPSTPLRSKRNEIPNWSFGIWNS
jgi:hypothetical protein